MSKKFVHIEMPESEQDKFKRWTEKLSKENDAEVNKLLVSTALTIERRAKMFAPVDMGLLRSSIRTNFKKDAKEVTVYVNRKYAPYPEFGTGNKVVIPDDVKDYAMTFKGKGKRKVNLRAQPYFFPAVRLGYKEMMMKLNQLGFQ